MAENIMIDKVNSESGASNSNATSQSQSVQLKVKRQRKKSFVEKEGYEFYESCTTFFRIPSRRTVTRDCFDLFNEEKLGVTKDFTVTVDNASSNDVTVKELSKKLTKWGTNSMNGKHLHMRCIAHIMNLVVQDGIKESIVSIECIRQAVRYIRQSPARAIEYESVILEYDDHDIGLSRHLEFVDIVDGSSAGTLLSSDWEDVKKLTKFLEIFYKLTVKVFVSLYVTSNHHFFEIYEVAVYLKQLILNEDVLLGSMAKKMKEKFDKYWGDPEKINKMIFISCVLDPRYKFDFVSFALAKMFEEKGPIIAKAVHTYMTLLFDEYVKSHSKDKGCRPSSCLSNSSLDTIETSTGSFGSFFEELKRHKAGIGGSDSKSELVKYLTEEVENEIADGNILLWCIGGRILDSFRSSLTPKLVEVLVCLQDWLRSEPLPVSVEEDLDVLEQLEQGVTMPRLCGLKAISHVWSHYERIEEGDDGWWKRICFITITLYCYSVLCCTELMLIAYRWPILVLVAGLLPNPKVALDSLVVWIYT
ncbi:zinc finger BED domain-containing protein RICESLEEPER 2-like [Nicotiana tabacum]|uniref:Zinc finger BED domain-containing protein RICESLEEPER 2-like n=1 Tax=Nicotiana tabacum TaxID=4097 RepID=A0AC58TGR0_TOBAC